MKLYFILAFFSMYNVLFSQLVCKGIVLDSVTGQIVEFVNIGIIGKGVGTVSNENGEYHFTVPDSLVGDKIKISMIGYKTQIFSVNDFKKHSRILLPRYATVLKEAVVSVAKTKVKIEGNQTKTKAVSAGFKNNSLGAEIGVKLSVKHPQTHIRKVMININANTLDTFPLFRLNIYKKDKTGYPGDNILTQNIIITPKEKTGFIEFDLRPYTIFVDEDVFVCLEWIKDLGDAKGLYFSTKLVGSSTYYRQTSQDKWGKMSPVGVGLHTEVAY